MRKNRYLIFIMLSLLTTIFTSCGTTKVVTKENYLLDTIIKLDVYGKNAEQAAEKAMDAISDIDDKMSPTKPTSEIYKINSNAGKNFVKVSDDTFTVVKRAIEYSKLCNGAFDITVGPLVNIWGIGTDKQRIPSKKEIDEKLKLIDYKNILLDEKNKSIKLKNPNEAIDLGAIAKGYTADKVKKVLLKEGVKTAFINLGGNVVTLGAKDDGKPWVIGIQDPTKERGEHFGILKVKEKSVVSSGNYERYFEKDGKRYHHILDSHTGYPSESGLIATTIISDNSIDGDALSTITFLLGADKGIKLIESLKGIEGVFVTADKKVYTTSGLKNNFELTNEEFTYEKGR